MIVFKENTIAANEGKEFENKVFKKPIAYNCIPQIDSFCENGYTKEEMKMINETRKILHRPDLKITATTTKTNSLDYITIFCFLQTFKRNFTK